MTDKFASKVSVPVFGGDKNVEKAKKYLINPVDSRAADMKKPDALSVDYVKPAMVETVKGFTEMDENALSAFIAEKGLAMDLGDAKFCRDYFSLFPLE